MKRVTTLAVLGFVTPFCLAQSGHRILVEVDTNGSAAYRNALGTVANLQKAFAGEPLQLEVVCLGPGIDLIFSHNNPLADRVTKLQKSGVAFAACHNTLHSRNVGKDRIFPFVTVVDSGAAEIVRKEEKGWSYLRR